MFIDFSRSPYNGIHSFSMIFKVQIEGLVQNYCNYLILYKKLQ